MQARLCEDMISDNMMGREGNIGIFSNLIHKKNENGEVLHELKEEWKKDWLRNIDKREREGLMGKYGEENKKNKEEKINFKGVKEYSSQKKSPLGKKMSYFDDDVTARTRNNTCLTSITPSKLEEFKEIKSKPTSEKVILGSKNRDQTNSTSRWRKKEEMKKVIDKPKKRKNTEESLNINTRRNLKTSFFDAKNGSNSFNSDTSFWMRKQRRSKLKIKKRLYQSKFAKFCDGLSKDYVKKENLEMDVGMVGTMDRNPIFGFSSYNSNKLLNKIAKKRGHLG